MGNRKDYLKKNIVWVCKKLDEKGFGANHDGNVSVRFKNCLLATPTSESKGLISEEMIITLDMEGKKIEGIGKPFSEIKLHLAAYNARSDINAVVHAHPPYATARGLLGLNLEPALPEAIVSVGNLIPVVDYAMPGTPENDEVAANALDQSFVFMMPGNGVLAVGENLEQAYLRLELVEHLAKIDQIAQTMGKPMSLSGEDVEKLLEKRAKAGLDPSGGAGLLRSSGAHNDSENSSNNENMVESNIDPLKKLIAEEIKRALENF